MKGLLFGFTIGAIAGMVGYNKIQQSKLPQKVTDEAKHKFGSD